MGSCETARVPEKESPAHTQRFFQSSEGLGNTMISKALHPRRAFIIKLAVSTPAVVTVVAGRAMLVSLTLHAKT
jgi:hypothetical protein